MQNFNEVPTPQDFTTQQLDGWQSLSSASHQGDEGMSTIHNVTIADPPKEHIDTLIEEETEHLTEKKGEELSPEEINKLIYAKAEELIGKDGEIDHKKIAVKELTRIREETIQPNLDRIEKRLAALQSILAEKRARLGSNDD